MLYTDGTSEANETEARDFVASFSKTNVDDWIVTNAPKLKTVIDAGDITISTEIDITQGVNNVVIFFDIENATGDRKRLLAMAAQVLAEFMRGRSTEVTNTYTVEKGYARNWARWVETLL